MKKFTTTAAIALITLASSSFAVAGGLDFDAIADADNLAGGANYASSQTAVAVDFDNIADADLLAGDSKWIVASADSKTVVAFDVIADADHLASQVCRLGAGTAE